MYTLNDCTPNSNMFAEFIVTSMKDYGETMLETLIKEMDYFLSCKYPSKAYTAEKFYLVNGATFLETEFRKFLSNWGLSPEDENFYSDIFMGRKNDVTLSKIS